MRISLSDVMGFGGIGLASIGAWLAWHPAGFMVSGALLIATAILIARGDETQSQERAP